MIGPIPSAIDALASYFDALDTNLTAYRGWPEDWQELDLLDAPHGVLAITAPSADTSRCSPRVISKVWINNELVTTYRVAWVSIPFQMDLFCPFRSARDDLSYVIENNLSNALPHITDLHILTSDYHQRPLKVTFEGTIITASRDTTASGLWRKTWQGTISTDFVIQTTHPKITQLQIQQATTRSGVTITG